MSGVEPERSSSAYAAIRDRCRRLGLPTWRFDSVGVLQEEPVETGLAGLWLRSSSIQKTVTEASLVWTRPDGPPLVMMFQGCWLFPLPDDRRSRRAGVTVAMALGEAGLVGRHFEEACRASQLEPVACRTAMRRFARFDPESARAAADLFLWMANDLSALAEFQDAVSGFTRELTQSYETISTLYTLGQGMRDLDQPERFLALVCDKVRDAIPFGWLAAVFPGGLRGSVALTEHRFVRGTPGLTTSQLDGLVNEVRSHTGPMRGRLVTIEGPQGETQVLVQPVTRDGALAGAFLAGDKMGDDPQPSTYDTQLLEAAAAYAGVFIENASLYADQQRMFLGSLKALTASIDAKDRYTRGHSERVAHVAALLARAMGLDERQAERVHICGLVHDVGKIGVPEAVLTKPGRLTPEEFGLIKLHPEIGYRILKDIPQLQDILPGVLHHHERWDGKGYPHGLAGDGIPLLARILGLADAFDAMSSTRSYRSAAPRGKVLAEIEACSGTQFDPKTVAAFRHVNLGGYDQMVARHSVTDAGEGPSAKAAA